MKYMDETVASWIAGIWDGEGHIGIHRSGYRAPLLSINVTNTNLNILKIIQSCIGGKLTEKKQTSKRHMQGYVLTLRHHEFGYFLKRIGPYLRAKTAQAMLMERAIELNEQGWTDDGIAEVLGKYHAIKAVALGE